MSKEKKIIANKRKPMKHSISDRVLDLINYTVFSLFAFVCVYPFYYIFINTISNNKLSESGAYMVPQGHAS